MGFFFVCVFYGCLATVLRQTIAEQTMLPLCCIVDFTLQFWRLNKTQHVNL